MKFFLFKSIILLFVICLNCSGNENIISEVKLNKFLELVAQGKSNPNGLIYFSREIFIKNNVLPNNYKSLFQDYLIKVDNNINFYTFLDIVNVGGSWWVKLEVDNLQGKVLSLRAMGKTK